MITEAARRDDELAQKVVSWFDKGGTIVLREIAELAGLNYGVLVEQNAIDGLDSAWLMK